MTDAAPKEVLAKRPLTFGQKILAGITGATVGVLTYTAISLGHPEAACLFGLGLPVAAATAVAGANLVKSKFSTLSQSDADVQRWEQLEKEIYR